MATEREKVGTGNRVGSEGCELFGHGGDLSIAASTENVAGEAVGS